MDSIKLKLFRIILIEDNYFYYCVIYLLSCSIELTDFFEAYVYIHESKSWRQRVTIELGSFGPFLGI